MANPELALLDPNSEILICPVCNEVVWKHKTEPINVRMSIPSRSTQSTHALMLMHQAAEEMYQENVLLPAEEACREHLGAKHRLRLWVWDRYGWTWVLRKWLLR